MKINKISKCTQQNIPLCSLDLMPLESFYLLSSFALEYDCWEIIMLWMEAFPLCSAACLILAALLKALKPQAYPSTHLSHSTFAFCVCSSFQTSILPCSPFLSAATSYFLPLQTQVTLSSLYKNK